jgi:O-antigen/teichoic acid export membrane protein
LRFNELNLVQIFGSVLSQILPLLVAANGNVELSFLVPAALAARLLSFFLLFRLCMRYIPISIKPVFDRTHLKPLLKYGGWISIMSLLAPLLVTVDRIVIAAAVGAKAVAHYTIPSDLVLKATIISTSLSTAIFPRLASKDSSQARDMSRRATLLLVAIMTPLVIIGQIAIHPFLIIWLGREFATVSAGVSEIILMGVWVNAIAISHHARLLTADNPKIVVIIYLIEIPIYFLLLWYGVTHLGILGVAIAWSLRVFIDTGILLAVGGAFRETVLAISVSLTMILMSTCVVLATEYTSPFRWVFGFVLILISVVKGKKYFIEIRTNFFSKDKSATL